MAKQPRRSRPDEARDRDLAVWYREASPEPSEFSNPDTDGWIVYGFRKEDLLKSPVLDASHLVEAPSGTHGFLRSGAGEQFALRTVYLSASSVDRQICLPRRTSLPGMCSGSGKTV